MLNNISIKMRLFILTAFMCAMISLIGYVAIQEIEKAMYETENVYEGSVDSIYTLSKIEKKLANEVVTPLQKLHDKKIAWQKLDPLLRDWLIESEQSVNSYIQNNAKDEYKPLSKELQAAVKKANSAIEQLLIPIQNEDWNALAAFIENQLYPLSNGIIKQTDTLIEMHIEETKHDYHTAIENKKKAISWMIWSIILTICASIIFSFFVIKSILLPLSESLEIVNQVTLGNTTMAINANAHDEIGSLMKSMQNMTTSATEMTTILEAISDGDLTINVPIRSKHDSLGKGLHNMVGRLQHIISEIQAEVNALTNSTQEIVTSVNQISTSTAETAAAVTETTTTVEELKQTAEISAEKAKDVLSNAEETLTIVKESKKTLQLTVEEMNQIQEKMSTISESIVKLSEHSLAIGEIIDTVNNLAEQSNLLAVNAAIEAAKAGDQGKGFGVVAQEIRTLAEQSKEATVQVRVILNDIQNATSAAVLATEQGSKAVHKGASQSTLMSEAINTLFSSISRVTQAANQITISSQQQRVGVEQVALAMNNIDTASSQHVEHMRQIETAVTTLNEVGISLGKMINQYQIASPENHPIPLQPQPHSQYHSQQKELSSHTFNSYR